MKLFDPDGPIMHAVAFIGNLILVDLLFILCCLPVVTVGAASTALYTVTLGNLYGKEGSVTKQFFAAFKANFKQATILWLILLVAGALLVLDYLILTAPSYTGGKLLEILFFFAALIYLPTLQFAFPILSHYTNTVLGTLKNALALSIAKLPQCLLMLLLSFFPLPFLYFNLTFFFRILPIWLVIGFSVAAQLNSYLFRRIFRKLESKQAPSN